MTSHQIPRRLGRLLALLAMIVGVLQLPLAVAHAAPSVGSITLVAERNLDTGVKPLPGVVFTVSRLKGVDPSTAAGEQAMHDAIDNLATEKPVLERSWTTAPTDSTGHTQLTDLPLGAYYIHQLGVIDATGELVRPTVGMGDSIVALPTAGLAGEDPYYDLLVMPKPVPVPLPQTPDSPAAPLPGASQTPGAPQTHGVPAPSTSPVPGNPALQQAPVVKPAPHPTTTRINSGDGADFNRASQWAMVALGIALVTVVFISTRRREQEQE